MHRFCVPIVRNTVDSTVLMPFLGVVRRHPRTAFGTPNQPLEQKYAGELCCAMAAVAPHRLNLPIQFLNDEGFMLTSEELFIETYKAAVSRISQDLVKRRLGPRPV